MVRILLSWVLCCSFAICGAQPRFKVSAGVAYPIILYTNNLHEFRGVYSFRVHPSVIISQKYLIDAGVEVNRASYKPSKGFWSTGYYLVQTRIGLNASKDFDVRRFRVSIGLASGYQLLHDRFTRPLIYLPEYQEGIYLSTVQGLTRAINNRAYLQLYSNLTYSNFPISILYERGYITTGQLDTQLGLQVVYLINPKPITR